MADGISISTLNLQTDSTNLINSVKSSILEDAAEEKVAVEDIITDIQQNKTKSIDSAQDLADEYGISLTKAGVIMNKLEMREEKDKITEDYLTENALTHGAVLDYPPPEGSTISYHI